MQMNINLNDIKRIDEMLEVSSIRNSKIADSKNVFKSEGREAAILRRYGKRVRITITYDMNGNKLKELTQRYQDDNNKVYSITEYFTENEDTDYCVLSCRRNEKNFEYRFNRFLDAEVTLIDMIAEG